MPKKPPADRAPATPRPKTAVRPIAIGLTVLLAVVFGVQLLLRTPQFVLTPNAERSILLVTIDTLRADAVGSYGGRALTPHLDRLAARGARFTFAHSHAVVTLPSHASILAGRYPYEHGIRDNTGYRFPAAMPTAATQLKARGFATGAFIGGFPLDRRFGLDAGFDVYDDRLDAAADESGERERRADAVVSSALEWIGGQQGPWFAWVHLYDPHVTYAAPKEWASRFPSDPYLAEVSWTDAAPRRGATASARCRTSSSRSTPPRRAGPVWRRRKPASACDRSATSGAGPPPPATPTPKPTIRNGSSSWSRPSSGRWRHTSRDAPGRRWRRCVTSSPGGPTPRTPIGGWP